MKINHLIKVFLLTLFLVKCSGTESIEVAIVEPIAYNDLYTTSQNNELVISTFLKNDKNLENTIVQIDISKTVGSIVKQNESIVTYTPTGSFIGKDSFEYTICDESNNNCSTATVFINVIKTNFLIAVKDNYTTIANKVLVLANLTDNDIIVGDAVVSSIDATSVATEGSLVLENNMVTYTPKVDFVGEDSFIYTICDNNNNCASALVIITIEEGIRAVDDQFDIVNNNSSTFSNLLENDVTIEGAIITEVGTLSSTQGTVQLETNGSVTYTPKPNYTGEDSFTYTLCESDDPSATCSTATVTLNVLEAVSFNIPASLNSYYNDVIFTNNSDIILQELKDVSTEKHTTILTYSERHNYLYDADEDLNNNSNVVLMYTGESRSGDEWTSPTNPNPTQTFNTEHVYPQSLYAGGEGGEAKDEIVRADLHHLRVCDAAVNTRRSNKMFVEGSGAADIVSGEWYPGDEWKGDVARMILYLNIRYGESIATVGDLDTFLKWNKEDPVSAFEEQRNTIISGAQGNRNPFIDNPYLATLIWGGEPAENKWE